MNSYRIINNAFSFILIFSISISAQFLNNSFENWDQAGEPIDWFTGNVPGVAVPISRTSDANDGNFAIKMEVIDAGGLYYSGNLQSQHPIYYGHPINQNYGTVKGYYKFSQKGSAKMIINAILSDGSLTPVGFGGIEIIESTNNWAEFKMPIEYFSNGKAANILLTINIQDTSFGADANTIGAFALIDNLSLDNPTSVDDFISLPTEHKLIQNFPNPFNPSTKIEYTISSAEKLSQVYVQLVVYDILGNEVATLVNENQKPGNYKVEFNASNLSSGVYLYSLKTGSFLETKRMILLR